MSKFKVGDRVRCYSGYTILTGTVERVTPIAIWVRDDPNTSVSGFHPKQCRKLIKRELKRVWINGDPGAHFNGPWLRPISGQDFSNTPIDGYTEYVEVRKK